MRRDQFGRETGDDLVNLTRKSIRIMFELDTSQCIAPGVMAKHDFRRLPRFISFAQRKMQVKAVIMAERFDCQRCLHGGHIVIGKAYCLQVGKAPVNFAQGRLDL